MGKLIVWIVVIFAVLVAIRLLNTAKARRRVQAGAPGRKTPLPEPMVRCVRCGIYLPKADSRPSPQGPTCGDSKCLQSR